MRQTIILASSSPRRKEILTGMGIRFECRSAAANEDTDLPPREAVLEISERKARAGAAGLPEGIVIGADTLVSLDGVRLGKPADSAEAIRMLRSLSGRTHSVFTGVCLLDAASGKIEKQAAETKVTFRRLEEDEIRDYVDTGEPLDKAGAYGIQGGAGAFVESIEGSWTNVMGLPVEMLKEMLSRMTEEQR